MHRFTAPTPVSLADRDLIQVAVDSWEIECCAEPPVVGRPSTWQLLFVTAESGIRPELCREHDWLVTECAGPAGATLTSGGVTALWCPALVGPQPPPGRARPRGYLVGTVHGGHVPGRFPRVTGLVQRVQVISERFARVERDGHPVWERVPESMTLTEVSHSPRWFTVAGDSAPEQTGVLLDLLVDRPSPPTRSN